jgi:hypothetical protein
MIYESIPDYSREEIKQATVNNDVETLLRIVLSIALYAEDVNYAQDFCIKFSNHAHFNVRGNSILGFGHLARIHGELDENLVKPIIESGLNDKNEFVRQQSDCAKDDTEFFLKWKYK